MGTINHNCVVATTWKTEAFDEVKMFILADSEMNGMCVFSTGLINGYSTIFCGPDGSEEGWPASDKADTIREKLITKIETYNYEDGSSPWDWVEIGWGEYGQMVLRGNNKNQFNNKVYADS